MTPPRSRRPAAGLGLGAVLGALTWAAWLGWDRTASYDVITGTVQTPYVTLQVLGCALTVGLVTAFLAARGHPVAAATGVGLGFWVVWTAWASSTDGSGLWAVGAVMLAVGLSVGTAVSAALGAWIGSASHGARNRRAARDASGRPGTDAG